MSGILRLESLTKGNTLKQGDKTPLKYRLFDADGEKLNIAGKSAQVRLVYPDFLTIGYEKGGLTVAQDDTVMFTIDKVIPAKLYHVEIIVDDQFIFPSREDESKFMVDKSSLGTEANIIEIVGVDAVARKATGMMKQDEKFIDDMTENVISDSKVQSFAQGIDAKATNALSLSESADTLSKSVQEQFNQIVIDGDSSVEAAQARVDTSGQSNPTLKARLDKEHNEVTTQLEQNAKGEVVVSDFSKIDEYIASLSLDKSVLKFPKATYLIDSPQVWDIPNGTKIIFEAGSVVKPNFTDRTKTLIKIKSPDPILITELTSDALRGVFKLSLSSVVGIKVGDLIKLHSQEYFKLGTTNKQSYELNRVVRIDGNAITLEMPIAKNLTSQGSIDSGGNGIIDVTIFRPRKIEVDGLRMELDKKVNIGLYIEQVSDVIYKNISIEDAYRYGVYLIHAFNVTIDNLKSYRHGDIGDVFGGREWGYGFLNAHSRNVNVINSGGGDGWHTFDTSDGAWDTMFFNCETNNDLYGFSTHESAGNVLYENCRAFSGFSVTVRALRVHFKNCHFSPSSNHGVGLQGAQEEVIFDNCILDGSNAPPVYSADNLNKKSLVVKNCVIRQMTGVNYTGFGSYDTILFNNNELYGGVAHSVINLSGRHSIIITDNQFKDQGTYGLIAGGGYGLIKNNKFLGKANATGSDRRLMNLGFDKVDIINNTFDVAGLQYGIHITKNTIIDVFKDNVFKQSQYYKQVTNFGTASTYTVNLSYGNLSLGGEIFRSADTNKTIVRRINDYEAGTLINV